VLVKFYCTIPALAEEVKENYKNPFRIASLWAETEPETMQVF
jgi:hypothetical protein